MANGVLFSAVEIARVAYEANFRGVALIHAIAVALAESSGYTGARNVNPATETNPQATTDRGLWQINDYWHPEVTDAQADDPLEAARAAFRISGGGTDWSQWTTWPAAAGVYLAQAAQAVGTMATGGPLPSVDPAGTIPGGSLPGVSIPPGEPATATVAALIAGANATISAANQQAATIVQASTNLTGALGGLATLGAAVVADLERFGYILIGLALALVGLWLVVRSGG